jgi:hypothetical protein
MSPRTARIFISVVVSLGLAGCASTKEEEVAVALVDLPHTVRATVEKVTAGGQVESITREVERGQTVYDVEATVAGKHLEFVIAHADGSVVGTEVPVEFSELPEAVRAAALEFFGSPAGLRASKGVEYGVTSFEIEGQKNGEDVEVEFDPAGKRLE